MPRKIKWLSTALCLTNLCLISLTACNEKREEPTQPRISPNALHSADKSPSYDPDSVPGHDTNYVATPAGLYHRSCVPAIADRSIIHGDTAWEPGRGQRIFPKCNYPHWNVRRGWRSMVPDPSVTGWILSAENDYNPNFGHHWRSVSAQWSVPNVPENGYSTTPNLQAWYTFPGITNSHGILQPVLGYVYAGGPWHWRIGAWFCGENNCPLPSLADVSVGDVISGSITASNCSSGSCDFTVTVTDVTTSVSRSNTFRTTDDALGLAGGALEGWSMNNCGDYPQSQVAYTNLSAADDLGSVTLAWGKIQGSGYMSGCGTDYVTTAPGGTITFRNVSLSVGVSGPTSVNSDVVTCYYSAVPNGGYAPNTYRWTVDGTILSGQNTGAIEASFTDGSHDVTVHATDGQGYTASNTITVNAQSGGRSCER